MKLKVLQEKIIGVFSDWVLVAVEHHMQSVYQLGQISWLVYVYTFVTTTNNQTADLDTALTRS